MVPERVRAWAQDQLDQPIAAIEPVGGGRTDTIYAIRLQGREPVILRYSAPDRWGEIGRQHIAAEALGCRLMSASPLPVPRLLASDPLATASGAFVNLTSWLPGKVRLDPLSPDAIDELARVAVVIHQTPVPEPDRPRPYEFWSPPDLAVPTWTKRPDLWRRAIEIFADGPPATPHGLIHRDFHPGNILWRGDLITGVIDWAETSWGPADIDVVHSCANFVLLHDMADAIAFREAYLRHGGVLDPDPEATRFWAVSDALGYLPDPVPILAALILVRSDLTSELVRNRLDQLLAASLR